MWLVVIRYIFNQQMLLTLDENVHVDGEGGGDAAGGGDLVTAVGGATLLVTAGGIAVDTSLAAGRDLDRWGGDGQSSKAQDGGDSRELHFEGGVWRCLAKEQKGVKWSCGWWEKEMGRKASLL
jgi:hypothetical protein